MKRFFFPLAIAVTFIFSSISEAATVKGKIVDEDTGGPVSQATIGAYLLKEGIFEYRDSAYVDGETDFEIPKLQAGTYAFIIDSYDNYEWEYYDNTRRWKDRKEITLKATDTVVLKTIKLNPYPPFPIYFTDVDLQPDAVPPEGGTVKLKAKIVNKTDFPRKLVVWPSVTSSYSSIFVHPNDKQYPQAVFMGAKEKSVTVDAGGEKSVSFDIKIPESASNSSYPVALYAGSSFWNPLVSYGKYSLFIFKRHQSDGPEPVQQSRGTRGRIPLRITLDGDVIEWR